MTAEDIAAIEREQVRLCREEIARLQREPNRQWMPEMIRALRVTVARPLSHGKVYRQFGKHKETYAGLQARLKAES